MTRFCACTACVHDRFIKQHSWTTVSPFSESIVEPWASEDPSNPSGALDEYTFVAAKANETAHARRKSQPKTRKDEKIFPDGQDSVNVAGLGAEEHLAAIHADQFHRLLRADSFDDFQDM